MKRIEPINSDRLLNICAAGLIIILIVFAVVTINFITNINE